MTREQVLTRWRLAERLLELMGPTASPEHVAWLRSTASMAFDDYVRYLEVHNRDCGAAPEAA